MFSRVWGNEGIGNIVKNDVLARFYGILWRQMCKLPRFVGKHCKNMQTHFKKHGVWRILLKKCSAKCRLDSFSGRRRRGYLKFPSLGGPHAGEKIKKHPLGGSQQRGEIVAWTARAVDGCEAF